MDICLFVQVAGACGFTGSNNPIEYQETISPFGTENGAFSGGQDSECSVKCYYTNPLADADAESCDGFLGTGRKAGYLSYLEQSADYDTYIRIHSSSMNSLVDDTTSIPAVFTMPTCWGGPTSVAGSSTAGPWATPHPETAAPTFLDAIMFTGAAEQSAKLGFVQLAMNNLALTDTSFVEYDLAGIGIAAPGEDRWQNKAVFSSVVLPGGLHKCRDAILSVPYFGKSVHVIVGEI